jgi:hypothetical protein
VRPGLAAPCPRRRKLSVPLSRRQLLEDPDVLFSGYRVPHPLEPAIQLKVQTTGPAGKHANPAQARARLPSVARRHAHARCVCVLRAQAVTSAISSLNQELITLRNSFKEAVKDHQAQ